MSNFKNAGLIITSIAAPNSAMKAFADGCRNKGIDFIVIGDTKSPKDFQLEGCRFYSIEEQRTLPIKLASHLPERHYSRKNIGYLLSKNKNVIIETDDDNLPMPEFWEERDLSSVSVIEKKGWVNVYRYFSEENIWPRGFPLESLQASPTPPKEGLSNAYAAVRGDTFGQIPPFGGRGAIIQGLADGNPDVDAVYRMTSKLPVNFEKKSPVFLGKNSWCPFNSQNTIWKKEAFPLLYLPSYCSFRMTDIWRSFIAQRIAWTCDWNIMFESSTVIQERNEHDLLKDFADEVSGYLNNSKICSMLEALDLKSGKENISENLLRCYKMMIENEWIKKEEMNLLEMWCSEF